jgi:hypothetical protein
MGNLQKGNVARDIGRRARGSKRHRSLDPADSADIPGGILVLTCPSARKNDPPMVKIGSSAACF